MSAHAINSLRSNLYISKAAAMHDGDSAVSHGYARSYMVRFVARLNVDTKEFEAGYTLVLQN